MTRIFCTLFDKNYLYQGVALHRSLLRHAGDFKLYALCMDTTAYALLVKMQCDTLIPISIEELLSPETAAVRARTTHGQFCWVCQPLICRYLLDRPGVEMVTYLEADSLFFASPERLFEELGDRSVSLVPHNYSAEFDNSSAAGRFCVQFNSFRNDAAAARVLVEWQAACFTYDKSAPNRFPGQTCLDHWPARFKGVAVIENRGAGVAPWNISGYRLRTDEHGPRVDSEPVVFYHYHQYGRVKGGAHELGSYPLSQEVVDCFYRPYVHELMEAERAVHAVDPAFNHRREYSDTRTFAGVCGAFSASSVAQYLTVLKRKLRGRYNVYPDEYFSTAPRGGTG
jgi:hypothetical protein